ncbi:hypothetical protein [Variovorax sp. 679]|uniref:hypothetical protein n=1 Tax=Variovorax sp. 679 TaxID=2496119 RepID=UPI003204A228
MRCASAADRPRRRPDRRHLHADPGARLRPPPRAGADARGARRPGRAQGLSRNGVKSTSC